MFAVRKQAPPPLRVDTLRIVLAGTALWAAALVVLLLLGDRVDPLWTWTCVAGIGLAGVGIGIMRLQGQLGPRRGGATGDGDRSAGSKGSPRRSPPPAAQPAPGRDPGRGDG